MTYGDGPRRQPGLFAEDPHVPAPPKRTGRVWLIVAISAAVLLLLCCGGGILGVVFVGKNVPVPTSTPSDSASPTASPSPTTEPIDVTSRVTDPRPLTVREVFPGKAMVTGGRSYRILRAEEVADCAKAAYGRTATALKAQGCSQVVRATVVDASGRYLATVGLANLRDTAAAERVLASQKNPNLGTFTPLAVPGTAASTFRRTNGGLVSGGTQGHYALYCWVGLRSNGDPPLTDKRIDRIIDDLCGGVTAAIDKRENG
jgi:hypothetical protein